MEYNRREPIKGKPSVVATAVTNKSIQELLLEEAKAKATAASMKATQELREKEAEQTATSSASSHAPVESDAAPMAAELQQPTQEAVEPGSARPESFRMVDPKPEKGSFLKRLFGV
ncbi:hypothetical protein [Vannielia sp.]|uniref:hypothetical protein n=1 Tax=Vannielia sp. TaxID=2813045 RepID=UPI00262E3724|nr:hypothetical protein [Vannielia sp.]MDF1871900.1 hypothetical protein [Vannielia sp.]